MVCILKNMETKSRQWREPQDESVESWNLPGSKVFLSSRRNKEAKVLLGKYFSDVLTSVWTPTLINNSSTKFTKEYIYNWTVRNWHLRIYLLLMIWTSKSPIVTNKPAMRSKRDSFFCRSPTRISIGIFKLFINKDITSSEFNDILKPSLTLLSDSKFQGAIS